MTEGDLISLDSDSQNYGRKKLSIFNIFPDFFLHCFIILFISHYPNLMKNSWKLQNHCNHQCVFIYFINLMYTQHLLRFHISQNQYRFLKQIYLKEAVSSNICTFPVFLIKNGKLQEQNTFLLFFLLERDRRRMSNQSFQAFHVLRPYTMVSKTY